MLGTDTLRTVAMFIYDDIQSGSRAQIGFDAGDRITSFTLPGALTSQTLDMEQSTNIETPGVFIYRLDSMLFFINGCIATKLVPPKSCPGHEFWLLVVSRTKSTIFPRSDAAIE